MKDSLSTPKSPPSASVSAKVAAIDFAVGVLWILFSDAALGWVVCDPSVMAKLAMAKGWTGAAGRVVDRFGWTPRILQYFLPTGCCCAEDGCVHGSRCLQV